MANTVQIRPELIKSGYTDQDIGYDEGRKMTTLKGQDFLGAGKYTNVAGSTFTDRMNFDNALKKYNQGQQPTPQMSSITSAGGGQPTAPVNQADQRYNELLNMLYQQAQSPQPVDVNAIYASPQYAAQQAQAQRGAQQGIRASQEALGSAGFGRSTTLGESAQREQNRANEYLQTQVLPQLMAQEQAQRQRQSQDQFSVLDALTKERNTADQLALQEAQLTGRLVSDQDRAAQPLLDELTRLGQAWKNAGGIEEKMAHSAQADRIRGQLGQMGVDPSLYDPNLSTEQRTAAGQGLGTPTLGAQQLERANFESDREFELAKAQQEWENAFTQGQFDFKKAQQAYENAFKERSFQQDMEDAAKSRGLQWANLGQRDKEFLANQKFREAQFDYQKEQDAIENEVAVDKPVKIDPKESVDNVQGAKDQVKGKSIQEALQYAMNTKEYYTDADYKALIMYINKNNF